MIHDFEPGWDTYIDRQGYGAEADVTFDEVNVDEYAAVLVLGGRAPEYLRHDARVLDIVSRLRPRAKWVFGICHGVQILAAAGLVVGKRVTAYENCRWEIEAAGATYVADAAGRARRPHGHGANLAVGPPGVLPAGLRVPDELNAGVWVDDGR